MTGIPTTKREQIIALKIMAMLREECKDDLITAVKALTIASQSFNAAFTATVRRFTGLQERVRRIEGGKINNNNNKGG
jgi:hypothetical protein